jgi:thiol-disulfide isomerase/thioredoxin
MKKSNLLLLTLLLIGNAWCQTVTNDVYLHQLSDRLGKIKYASYYYYQSASFPGDTTLSLSYAIFKKEFIALQDTFVGAYIASFDLNDTSRLEYFYDGTAKAYVDHINKCIPIDSFQNNPYPFRIVYPPFITYVRSLLTYALETTDSISLSFFRLEDTTIISLYVKNKFIEVVGNKIVEAEIPDLGNEQAYSRYDIWIDEKDNLPFKIVKRFTDRKCLEMVEKIKISETSCQLFVASAYFPSDYEILAVPRKTKESSVIDMIAPDWKLKDVNDNEISLQDLTSKILLLQFTGLGCGPCQLSIPFMKDLLKEYNDSILEMVIIETWSNNKEAIKKYHEKNGIQCKCLLANSEIIKNYRIESVPTFLLLDKKRTIRHVIVGFNKSNTLQEIKMFINQMFVE